MICSIYLVLYQGFNVTIIDLFYALEKWLFFTWENSEKKGHLFGRSDKAEEKEKERGWEKEK